MLKIETKKIWELLRKDKSIQKELAKYIEEEKKKLEEAQNVYRAQFEVVENLKQKKEDLRKKENHIDDEIVQKNGDISFLEIKKYFAERRYKRLMRIALSTHSRRKKAKFLKRAEEVQENIQEIEEKQNNISSEIHTLECEKESVHSEQRDLTSEISRNMDYLEENGKTVRIWQEEYDKKLNRFYQASYEEVTEYFQPCQDLVVPDLEESKKMSKEAAKEKANPIIIDEEKILSSPEQLRVRKLTKDEKEEYRKVA